MADALNNRILFISPSRRRSSARSAPRRRRCTTRPPASGYPNGDTPLANGNVLVSEINGSWIDEYTPAGKLVWTVHLPTVELPLRSPAARPDLYLMTDYDPPAEGTVLTIRRSGAVVWVYDVPSGDGMLKKPSLAERLPNGLIMVNDDYRNRVVVIDPRYDAIVWQYGITDVAGTAPGLLSIPDGFDLLAGQRHDPDPSADRLSHDRRPTPVRVRPC